jgi:hypothetical protein
VKERRWREAEEEVEGGGGVGRKEKGRAFLC